MGDDREWKKQIRNGNVGRDPREPHRCNWRQYRETCCESQTETNTKSDAIFSHDHITVSSAAMDRR